MDTRHAWTRTAEIADRFKLLSLKPQIDAVGSLLDRMGAIDVAVLGRFKAGKSTLLNAVSGDSVLPVGVTPVTSVITRIRYGPEKRATVVERGGGRHQISFSEIASFVSETGNPENVKSVAAVEIELPTLKSFEGLEFVDTPGLGSVFKHNTEVSLDWLPRVGAALVAIGVDPPLSEQDLDLIGQALKFSPRVTVVLTKADLLSQEQRDEVRHFVEKQLQKRFPTQVPIYFYSVQPTFKNLRDALACEVLSPLYASKEAESRLILTHKMSTLLAECSDLLRISLEASTRTQTERQRLKEQILGEKLMLESTRDELRMLTREWLGRTRPSYMKRLAELQEPLLSQFLSDLEAQFPNWRFDLYRFTRSYEEWMHRHFGEELSLISSREEQMFHAPLRSAEQALTRAIRAFQGRLTSNIEEFLGIRIEPPDFKIEASRPQAPDVSVGRAFDSHLDLLWFLVPMTIFRKPVERHFLKQLPFEVEKNLSRLASQWTERVNASITALGQQAERFVTEEVKTMENLLVQTSDPTIVVRDLLHEVESFHQQVRNDFPANPKIPEVSS